MPQSSPRRRLTVFHALCDLSPESYDHFAEAILQVQRLERAAKTSQQLREALVGSVDRSHAIAQAIQSQHGRGRSLRSSGTVR